MDAIEQLHEMIEKSEKIVFFGGRPGSDLSSFTKY